MLYYLFDMLEREFHPPGFGIFRYITFRSALAAITALLISFVIGPIVIRKLHKYQIGEQAKVEGPKSHLSKAGTPTMGGLIIIGSVVAPLLLWGDLGNLYVLLMLLITVGLGLLGFIDDYMKVVKKKRKGLIARYKLIGQITIGLIVGAVLFFSPQFRPFNSLTTIPFFKNLNFDYSYFYIPVVVFIITATSNAVNLTDGIDGLAVGTVGIVALTLALMSYISGNIDFSRYLNIIYLRGSGELTVYCAALLGASLGFLWYNTYPAQVFMGDTGSLALGGAIAGISIMIKKELVLPILGGIFLAEELSVIAQVLYFKYTKKKYGEGRRIFRMAPFHHHFELSGVPEPKIVTRFYIAGILLAILSLTTFKVR
ncbi:MAG: phospho-N-acetylmuramoyl-pentapeptide-transferase [Candidatus Kryptoniota bacterium]